MPVELAQQEVSKYFTKTAITLCQEVCREVVNNTEWPYAHQVFLSILEVVQVVKQPWSHQVYLQACVSMTYCITPKHVLASVQHSMNSMHTGT